MKEKDMEKILEDLATYGTSVTRIEPRRFWKLNQIVDREMIAWFLSGFFTGLGITLSVISYLVKQP